MTTTTTTTGTTSTSTTTTPPSSSLLMPGDDELIEISLPKLALSLLPLIAVAVISHHMGLEMTSAIVVGIIRTFVQLSILGAILTPIFVWGTQHAWIVALYVVFMILLASFEASSRSKYYFQGMTASVLLAFTVNVSLLSWFAFGMVIQPTPVWDPKYVIPVVGMLLGNCINGVSLANNSFLTALVEQSAELEIHLSFGANAAEASARFTRQAARVGAMPTINSMSVIGLISIPGMMTGQILGGSNVQQAARYQMLIMYMIATITFGTILLSAYMSRRVAFSHDCLQAGRIKKSPEAISLLTRLGKGVSDWVWITAATKSSDSHGDDDDNRMDNDTGVDERTPLVKKNGSKDIDAETATGTLEFISMSTSSNNKNNMNKHCTNGSHCRVELQIINLSRTLTTERERRTLFENVSAKWHSGDIIVVRGPSGTGKSQFSKQVAGLLALDSSYDDSNSDIRLNDMSLKECKNLTHWRRQVRYVSQSKVDIPGTPSDFVQRIAKLQTWRSSLSASTLSGNTKTLVQEWGLNESVLDREWNKLSGGEAQRVYLAIAVATRPAVLIMDESTSALDVSSKQKVERSIEKLASEQGMVVLWVTHDQEQMERMGRNM